jgi:hypothetical protein
MTTESDTAPLGCREPSLGAAAGLLLGRPLPLPLLEHLGRCLACQLERHAFERFERGETDDGSRANAGGRCGRPTGPASRITNGGRRSARRAEARELGYTSSELRKIVHVPNDLVRLPCATHRPEQAEVPVISTYDSNQFFDFWRRRVDNARWLREQARSLDPEIQLVVTAGLDALANHWAATFEPGLNANSSPKGRRLHEFLTMHGDGPVFRKVSVPDLVRRGHEASSPVEEHARRNFGSLQRGRVRYWDDDPDAAIVFADGPLMAAAPSLRWVEKSRYAEILYSALRCGWVHEFNPERTTSAAYEDERGRPRYQNYASGVPQRLVFPVDYLIMVWDACISGFEERCHALGISPIAR